MLPTYTWHARSVPLGLSAHRQGSIGAVAKALLFNSEPDTVVDILRTDLRVMYAGAGTRALGLATYCVCRIDSVTGGVDSPSIPFDSAAPLPSQVVCRTNPDVGWVANMYSIGAVYCGTGSAAPGLHITQSYHEAVSARRQTITPILLREGEGIAIAPDPLSGQSGMGPMVIDVTVIDVATGASSLFTAPYVALDNSPAMCVFNGIGSGVTLAVTHVGVAVPAFAQNGTVARCSWYIADQLPSNEPLAYDDSSSIVAHDSANPLPTGISAWRGEMGTLATRAALTAMADNAAFVPINIGAAIEPELHVNAIARTMSLGRKSIFNPSLLPTNVAIPTARSPQRVGAGSGFALGVVPRLPLTQSYMANSSAMDFVADIEIVFQVRLRSLRRNDFVSMFTPIEVTGTVYGAVAGTVAITLHRSSDGEKLAETTRSGSGAWTLTWYDDTEDVYVAVVDDGGRSGRSRDGIAGTDALDVILGVATARVA